MRRKHSCARQGAGAPHFALNRKCAIDHHGSEYGGWAVVRSTLNKSSVVYSFGVGDDVTFDLALIKDYGLKVHGFDPTPKSIEWVKTQQSPGPVYFSRIRDLRFDGSVLFFPPENPQHISYSILRKSVSGGQPIKVLMKRLPTILKELGHDRIDLLKLDIEGAEFRVIDDMAKTAIRPKQILIEFHHRFKGVGKKRLREAVRTLREIGYHIFSVSENDEDYGFVHSSVLQELLGGSGDQRGDIFAEGESE